MTQVSRRTFIKTLAAGVIVAANGAGMLSAEDAAAVDALLDGGYRHDGFKFYVIGTVPESLQIVPPGQYYNADGGSLQYHYPEWLDLQRLDQLDQVVQLTPWRRYAEDIRHYVPDQYRANFERALRGLRN